MPYLGARECPQSHNANRKHINHVQWPSAPGTAAQLLTACEQQGAAPHRRLPPSPLPGKQQGHAVQSGMHGDSVLATQNR